MPPCLTLSPVRDTALFVPSDGRGVHLAGVDRVVAAVPELLDPVGLFGRQPRLVAVHAVGVDVLT